MGEDVDARGRMARLGTLAMKIHSVVCGLALLLGLGVLTGTGCVPTVDPTKQAPPSAAPASAPTAAPAPDTAVAPAPAPAAPSDEGEAEAVASGPLKPAQVSSESGDDGPQSKMKFQVLPRAGESAGNAVITVEKKPEGFYTVSGGKGLQATIKPDPAGGWLLEGTLTFPLKGYKPSEPFTGQAGGDADGPIYSISLPFSYPPKGSDRVEQEESFPISYKFDAPANAQFVVFLMPSL